MTGSKRRGLADFLGKELKSAAPAPPPPPAAKSVSSRVRKSVGSSVALAAGAVDREDDHALDVSVEVSPTLVRAVTGDGSTADAPARGEKTLEVTESVEGDGVSALPPYLRLTRKEVRFREAQLDALDRAVRRLMRARRPGAERITENTLVRVAVDLLLARADELSGSTEAELLRSVLRK